LFAVKTLNARIKHTSSCVLPGCMTLYWQGVFITF